MSRNPIKFSVILLPTCYNLVNCALNYNAIIYYILFMKKKILKALFLVCIIITNNAFSQTQKYIRKAEAAVYKGIYNKAKTYYLKAIEKEPENSKPI